MHLEYLAFDGSNTISCITLIRVFPLSVLQTYRSVPTGRSLPNRGSALGQTYRSAPTGSSLPNRGSALGQTYRSVPTGHSLPNRGSALGQKNNS